LQGGRHLQNCQPAGLDDVLSRIRLRPVNVIETGGVACSSILINKSLTDSSGADSSKRCSEGMFLNVLAIGSPLRLFLSGKRIREPADRAANLSWASLSGG